MLQFFRKLLSSKVGAGIALLFLALIAFAFASGDVANTGSFGGVAGGDRVATVGDERIGTAELSQAATASLERVKQQNPTMSMKAFLASGALDDVLDGLIDRTAMAVFGRDHGITANDRLVDSEITQMAAFKGPDGSFSQDAFRAAIRQSGLSEAAVRADLAQGLIARQILLPAQLGATVPREFAKRYASLLKDRRFGSIAVLPAQAFAPAAAPSDAELATWYNANRNKFIRPERRKIRYAVFGEDAVKAAPAPTDAEVAALYEKNKAQYAARESRTLTQLIVPTEAAAKAIVAEVSGGKSLTAAASAKGLETATLENVSRDDITRQSSQAVADAAFAASRGAIAAPAKGPLGWHVLQVSEVQSRPARSLDAVRSELVAQVAEQKRRAMLTSQLETIEAQFDEGGNLAEAAKDLGIEIRETEPITADGRVYATPDRQAPAELARVIETAFAMEGEGEPQLAEIEPGKQFVIFDVTDVQSSAPAPLREITDDVSQAYLLDKGTLAAKAAAEQVRSRVTRGETFAAALASLGKRLPPVQTLNLSREDYVRMQQQSGRPAPPIALFFSMAAGTTKMLRSQGNNGYYVVKLDKIETTEVADNDPLLASARQQLGTIVGDEYGDALRRAIRKDVGVERNANAIKAVRDQLSGGN